MTGSPPTVWSVYVTLKSVVSYQVKGSRYVPRAASGMSFSDIPSRLLLDGWLLLELEVVLEESPPDFWDMVTPTATAMAIMTKTTKRPIPVI